MPWPITELMLLFAPRYAAEPLKPAAYVCLDLMGNFPGKQMGRVLVLLKVAIG